MLSAVPAGFPVGIVKAVDADAFTGRDVDKLVFPKVNTDMGRAFFIGREKYEIARLELVTFFDSLAEFVLLIGGAGKIETVLLEDILDEAGAVEAFRCRTSEDVFCPYVFFRCLDYGVDLLFR